MAMQSLVAGSHNSKAAMPSILVIQFRWNSICSNVPIDIEKQPNVTHSQNYKKGKIKLSLWTRSTEGPGHGDKLKMPACFTGKVPMSHT